MYWVNFLHIYQPSDQSKNILEMVVNESYRPLFKGLLNTPGAKINLNINGGLTELLAKNGYQDVIEDIKQLAKKKKLEFTESAKYHALLPFLDREEIIYQIQENHFINRKYFGSVYHPVAFFPPEMAYSKKVAEIVAELGYALVLLDEIAFDGGKNPPAYDTLFRVKGTKNLIAVFRGRRVSNCIMSGIVRTKKEFLDLLKDDIKKPIYLYTAMDGETFGHHRPGLEKSLFKILSSETLKQIFISELPQYFQAEKETEPVQSTWATTKEEVEKHIQFYPWKNPQNKVHQLQWKFFHYLLGLSHHKVLSAPTKNKLYKAMASDQFFWASGEPWWSIEMIEKGAWIMLETLKSLSPIKKSQITQGEEYYKNIISTAFWWQRSGKIEKKAELYKEETRIPFKKRTLEKGKPEVYQAFIEMMRRKMWQATKKKNFERAILWRDAIWKLETKNDIYDTIHAVDLLRSEVSDKKLRMLMDRYKEKYKKIKPGQPELRKV